MPWTTLAPGASFLAPNQTRRTAMQIAAVGLDISKHVFQIHAVDGAGDVVIQKRLRRSELLRFFEQLDPCLIGIEACGTSHHWARELTALGHQVKLMPPTYVKPYVRGNKNDAADAGAICEAVTRPTMRFVPIKGIEQQAVLVMHRVRSVLVRQRTMMANALRGHMAEFGIIAPQGLKAVRELGRLLEDPQVRVPDAARATLRTLIGQMAEVEISVREIEKRLVAWHRADETSRRLATIPGVGPITASAISATVGDAKQFKSGREFAAWLGLVPRQKASGMKNVLSGISKRGDKYIRRLLISGAVAIVRYSRAKPTPERAWVNALLQRRPAKVAAVALANKTARIAWALMVRKEPYESALPKAA
jgi:transposase